MAATVFRARALADVLSFTVRTIDKQVVLPFSNVPNFLIDGLVSRHYPTEYFFAKKNRG
jgi:hypothetical protein